ncbi:MAG: hypothetical protein NTU91_09345 [Chloroflexi bacterium]|nr:hypothetical protein [Chloroflexota bacterium]
MTTPAASYLKVSYDLRPAKQVERRMMIDVLQRMAAGGFPIRDYQYTGMGSIYFVDFILFHRLLGLRRLLSAEHDTNISRRIRFNRPFACVEVAMEPIGDAVAKLDRDLRHLVWLDYDYRLNKDLAGDISLASSTLPAESILLVTVDAEAPSGESPSVAMEYYRARVGEYFDLSWTPEAFAPSHLSHTLAKILGNIILSGIAGRRSLRFSPLFGFEYADTNRMVTIGGLFANDATDTRLGGCDFKDLHFIRRSLDEAPFEIKIPRLTRKERLYLDHHMPCSDDWEPTEFELAKESVQEYARVYRYYPTFAELLA